jgi:acetyl esterase/lipase
MRMRWFILSLLLSVSTLAFGQTTATTPAPTTQSPAAPNSGAPETDVVYGEAAGTKLLLDIYRPTSGKPPYPAVVLIHGGSWSSFDKGTMAGIGRFLAHNGFVAFAIDYRLLDGTRNQWPAQLDDAQRAVRWIRANAKKYDVDRAHIGAFGHSAGAQIASLLGELETRDNSDRALAGYSSKVQAVVDVDGPADFTDIPAGTDTQLVTRLLGGTPIERPDAWRSASPALVVSKDTAPFLVFHGTRDEEVNISQSEKFVAALQKAGVPVTFIKVDDVHTYRTPEARHQLVTETLAFFNKTLQPTSAK